MEITHYVFIAVSTNEANKWDGAVSVGGWSVADNKLDVIAGGGLKLAAGVPGYSNKGLWDALTSGLDCVPAGASVCVITTTHVEGLLSRPSGDARYRNGQGKPIKEAAELLAVDALASTKRLTLTARRPQTFQEEVLLGKCKPTAKENAVNVENGPGEWNT